MDEETKLKAREQIRNAVLSCGHSIDRDEIILRFNPKQEGHNALNQLARRLDVVVDQLIDELSQEAEAKQEGAAA